METADWIAALAGITVPVIGVVLAWALKRVEAVLEDRFGIDIEDKHMRTLHSAVMTGLRAGLARGMTPDDAMRYGIEYAKSRGSAEAIEWFEPSMETLQDIALSKLEEVMPKGYSWAGNESR